MKTLRFVLLLLLVGVSFASRAFGADAAATDTTTFSLPSWMHEVWFWIVLIVPSVLTGLTRYKQFGWASTVLDIFSLVTHRDSPGFLQLPVIQQSKPPAPTDKVTP